MSYELVIEAGRTERQYWKDLWRYRELFLILTWRDVAVQYKQTVVGILWAVLGTIEFPERAFSISLICACLFMLLGIKVFRKTERTFADVI